MGSMNKHILVGTVGKDPVLRTTTSGKTVCEISIATNDGDKDAQGNNLTNWHKVICFDKTAEYVGRAVVKGTVVLAEGPCKLRSFTGKEGKTIYIKETIAFKVEGLAKTVKNPNPASYTPNTQPPMPGSEIGNLQDAFPGSAPAGEEHTSAAPPPAKDPWD